MTPSLSIQDEDLYLMANVSPKSSGLPFTVYISERNGPHDAPVKAASGPRARREWVAVVSVREPVEIKAGNLTGPDFKKLHDWIELNREVIVGYWERTILSTADALAALKRLPAT